MNLRFPYRGIDKGRAYSEQQDLTSSNMKNVRPRDSFGKRMRGGQRPGLDKWGAGTQIGATEQPVVAMCVVSTIA